MLEEKDFSKIFTSEEVKECVIPFQGQEWKFKYRELPWVTLNKIASKSLDYTGKKITIDRSEYDVLYLEA